ncbi:hypothetical protein PACTADRAFT_48010, partial [Pachysolen tannophilus NRRL Y-2460]
MSLRYSLSNSCRLISLPKKNFFEITRSFSSSVKLLNDKRLQQPVTFRSIADQQQQQQNSLQNKNLDDSIKLKKREEVVKYILHCTFAKNNTHMTLAAVVEDKNFEKNNPQLSHKDKTLYYLQLPQKVKISLSTGCVGFRKAQRGEYEAGYQLAAKMFQTIEQRNYLDKNIEVIMKLFGKGRKGFVDAFLGKEGTNIREKITRISD